MQTFTIASSLAEKVSLKSDKTHRSETYDRALGIVHYVF